MQGWVRSLRIKVPIVILLLHQGDNDTLTIRVDRFSSGLMALETHETPDVRNGQAMDSGGGTGDLRHAIRMAFLNATFWGWRHRQGRQLMRSA